MIPASLRNAETPQNVIRIDSLEKSPMLKVACLCVARDSLINKGFGYFCTVFPINNTTPGHGIQCGRRNEPFFFTFPPSTINLVYPPRKLATSLVQSSKINLENFYARGEKLSGGLLDGRE